MSMEFEDDRGFEKRAPKRIKQPFTAKFQIASEQASASWDIVLLRDLSSGGALFNYDKELEIDTPVHLSIAFPIFSDPIVCSAKVVRTKRLEGRSIYETAVYFTAMDDSTRSLINHAASTFFSKNT